MPIKQTTTYYGLEFFPDTSEVYQMEGFSNQITIEGIVTNHLSSCNLEQLKILQKMVHNF